MNKESVFVWERLGNVIEGRGALGTEMPVEVYRLMQYTMMDELCQRFNASIAQDIIRNAGYRAGKVIAANKLDLSDAIETFIAALQKLLKELKIGILKIEQMDLDTLKFILTVDEDVDCSGLPVSGESVCFYDEGFISAILSSYTGRKMKAVEIDCWATGGRTCRFLVQPED